MVGPLLKNEISTESIGSRTKIIQMRNNRESRDMGDIRDIKDIRDINHTSSHINLSNPLRQQNRIV